jgi:D-glycero-alpha-D-manno-heptose 1-phosphate guanylyltransferase
MIIESIILAGGAGTRLKSVLPNLPKCMAPVAGRPFLFYVINYLRSQGIEKFVFSLGYKHEMVLAYLEDQFSTLQYQYTIEDEALGTGGGIQYACSKCTQENIIVINGDTLFKANLKNPFQLHQQKNAHCTLLLKPMKDFDRYGIVELDSTNKIQDFKEKKHYATGFINGGIYLLNKNKFLEEGLPPKFSFEKDYLEKKYSSRNMYGQVQDEYFIDIGIPEDYNRANVELKANPLELNSLDKTWTLFIDRDGVINKEKKDEYITNWNDFIFYDGVKEAFKKIAEQFGRIIVITNQRGVGKALMTEDDLSMIHKKMKTAIHDAGGRIDQIFYCTSTDNKHPSRKPNPGMAHKALLHYPEIELSKSIMIGNKPSDMLFGRNAGVYTVFLKTTNPQQPIPHPDIDLVFETLADFAKACLPVGKTL